MDFQSFQNFIFDSDGVLLEDGNPLPGAAKLTKKLLERGNRVFIFSNNSTKHPDDMKNRYLELKIVYTALVNSGILAVNYLRSQGISHVYVVGEKGLEKLLEENNITITSEEPQAVIVGMDRTLTYSKLAIASRHIQNGVRFIATNPDTGFPTPRGLEPGAGSMIAAIASATDINPEIILGKPNKFGYEYIINKYNLDKNCTLFIGDRFETDIAGALDSGIPAIIVNTGVAKTRKNPGKYQGYKEVNVVESLNEILLKL